MRNPIFILSLAGFIAASVVAYVSGITRSALPPAFDPPGNPYARGIYAQGIIESDQASGENINIYPEVAGTVKRILATEGAQVRKGDILLQIDDSVQRAATEALQSQADAARTVLNELRAQPRKEALDVAEAQVVSARATLKAVRDAGRKQRAAYAINPKSVSRDALDNAVNAVKTAEAGLNVASRQRDLLKAGAWSYDIAAQERQYDALVKAHASADALLSRYALRAPKDGVVLAIHPAEGSFVSTQGSYDSYTQGMTPVLVLGTPHDHLNVRCYVDEILIPRLPDPAKMKAELSVRGSPVKISLSYARMQPLVSPKIELSSQRLEKVDVRVLPIIFRFEKPKDLNLYPGQLVDIYIGE